MVAPVPRARRSSRHRPCQPRNCPCSSRCSSAPPRPGPDWVRSNRPARRPSPRYCFPRAGRSAWPRSGWSRPRSSLL
ncbi:MAG TPA: hypothetical protein DF699_15450 [Phycisphaerales bacterium]|nr:hypothetical protein [Phycisphaerales bacterium]